jgi:nicotinamidase-related amidase
VVALLTDDSDSVLVVVDAQPGFLRKLEPDVAAGLAERIAWLVQVAQALGVPIVATEEEPDVHGSTDPVIAAHLVPDNKRWVKPTFGLAFTPEILADVERSGRHTAVLCGLETDVCVAQSALGLAEFGWKVAVVSDAVGAPGPAHQQGLDRMGEAGVTLIGLKGLYYEWIRRVDRLSDVNHLHGRPPAGITL